MPLLLKPIRCPHCNDPIDKPLLRRNGVLKDFLKSTAFACPHCGQGIKYPENGDTFMSMGIFVAVILAPLFHFWDLKLMDTRYLFGTGIAIMIIGSFTQKLVKEKLPKISPPLPNKTNSE